MCLTKAIYLGDMSEASILLRLASRLCFACRTANTDSGTLKKPTLVYERVQCPKQYLSPLF